MIAQVNQRFAILVATAALAGCATVNKQPITQAAVETLKGQSVAQTSRKMPDFAAVTPGKAAFALLGALAMIAEGNSIVANNKVADPADAIAAQLAAALSTAHGGKVVTPSVAVETDDAAQVAAKAGLAARFVLDVQTQNWSLGYFPNDWSHYRVTYSAKARLIDTQSKAVVAEGFCRRMPETNTNAPTYDQLLADNAKVLKSELELAAESCVKSLRAEMLTI